MSEPDWDAVLTVNLKGAFLCAQHAIKNMIKQSRDSRETHDSRESHESFNKKSLSKYIINISSIVSLTGNSGQANYAASKAGLNALTKTLAQEYGSRSITVNAIAPGFIQTRMTDKLSDPIKERIKERIALRKFGTPDDIAHLVLFLTSGNADYITGQIIEVTGGLF
jgi:3-oxoacyl-[acyl-carrier protein] reductase